MNFEYFFAKRITFKHQRAVSGLVVKLAVISIALAVAVMEIALSFVQGFDEEIQNKVIGFGSHIQIGNYLGAFDNEIEPLPKEAYFKTGIENMEQVASVAPYVIKWGMIKSKTTQEGVMLKGIDESFDWEFFEQALISGELPVLDGKKASREVLISKRMSNLLQLEVGDKATAYFFQDPPKRRPLKIVGIYETGMEEFDNVILLCDMRLLQKVIGWEEDQVMGFEVNLTDTRRLLESATQVEDVLLDYPSNPESGTIRVYEATPITEIYPEIFDWLRLQHQNVWLILILMVIVAVINMTSVILILIIERTRTIGILQALGLSAFRTQKLFIWNALFLILLGVVIGNLLGLGLLASQDWLGWLKLNQENYFIKEVPVAWTWSKFLLVNLGVIAVCGLFMFIPSLVISRISPVRAIRFD